jgi:hypothetical protein
VKDVKGSVRFENKLGVNTIEQSNEQIILEPIHLEDHLPDITLRVDRAVQLRFLVSI